MRAAARAALALALLVAGCGQGEPKAAPRGASVLRFEQAGGTDANPIAARMEHGRRLARVLGCEGCHGADLTGRPWDAEPEVAISFTSNLTRALPGYSDAQLDHAIRVGVRPDGSALWGMPSEIFTHLDASDMAALIAYLRTVGPAGTVHPRPVFGPRGRAEIAGGEYLPAPRLARAQRDLWPARPDGRHDPARYMTRATCGECHKVDLGGSGPTPDLIVAGAYTREEFRRLLRTGVPIGGRTLTLMAQVARERFVHLTEREVDAIHDYLVARAETPR